MGGTKSRNKGKAGEREAIAFLQPVVTEVFESFGEDAPRLQRDTRQSDGGGSDISGLPWAAIEVKNCATLAVPAWWAQTVRQAGKDRTPILLYRATKVRWQCRMLGLLGTPSAGVTVPVTVDLDAFLAWFRIRLVQELS